MYTNIPIAELLNIIESLCEIHLNHDKLREEIIQITKLITRQNHFQFLNQLYRQDNGLAMGAPTSSIFSEIFLQHMENTTIYKILTQNHIIGYFRYVEDILIIYNKSHTDIHNVVNEFNNINTDIKFTMEEETDNSINFLDKTIKKVNNTFTTNIYRKPTTTDSVIPRDSCHPQEHKHAAIRYMTNRMNTYKLNPEI